VKSESAEALAEELERTYKSTGFKILWDQYWREVRRAELNVVDVGVSRDTNPSRVAMELKYRTGFLDGVKALHVFHLELLEALKAGRIPWLKR